MKVNITVVDEDEEQFEIEFDVDLFNSSDEGCGAGIEVAGPPNDDPRWPAIERAVAHSGGWDEIEERAIKQAEEQQVNPDDYFPEEWRDY